MPHSALRMIAVVKHSVSFYQPFFSDVNSWGWSLLLLTVSHTRIQWLHLDLVSWHLRKCYLDLFFLFGLQPLFQTSRLPKELVSNESLQTTAPTPMSPVPISCSGFTTSAPALPHTSSLCISVSSCLNVSDMV